MAKKYRLLLLDAGVVIELFRLGLWDKVIELCDVHLSRVVAEKEVRYYRGHAADKQIDLSAYTNKISVVDVDSAACGSFLAKFDPTYLERLDPGELESLVCLTSSQDQYLLCSGDKIVYRVLGRLGRAEQGISLEEILAGIGLGRPLRHEYEKAFREEWTRKGQQEGIMGFGLIR